MAVKKTKKPAIESDLTDVTIKDFNGKPLTVYTEEMVKVIKDTLTDSETTDAELYYFLQVSAMKDLNPFTNEIYFTRAKDGGIKLMSSQRGLLKLAKKDPAFIKIMACEVRENDEFKMQMKLGEIKDIIHNFNANDRGKIIGAYSVLTTTHGITAYYVDFKEVAGRAGAWVNYPADMIKKFAKTKVLDDFIDTAGINAWETMPMEEFSNNIEEDISEEDIEENNEEENINIIDMEE